MLTRKSFSASTDQSGNLTLPLDPAAHNEIEQDLIYTPGHPPRPTDLVALMANNLYILWKNTANLKYTSTTKMRRASLSFEWTITPKLQAGAILNPLKVGIAALWAWKGALLQHTWPDRIQAKIWDSNWPSGDLRALEVGSLDIASTKPPFNDEDRAGALNSSLSAIPPQYEKRWLQCFTIAYWYAMSRFPGGMVVSDPFFHQQVGTAHVARFKCGGSAGMAPLNPGDRLDIRVSQNIQTRRPSRITWDNLAESLKEWILQVALIQWDYDQPWSITTGGPGESGNVVVYLAGKRTDDVAASA